MPWLKSVKFLTSQFIRSVCINNAKSSMGTSLKSTWVRVKILTCRNFVTHIVIFTAYPGPLILSIDIDFNLEMELNDVQSTIDSHMIIEFFFPPHSPITTSDKFKYYFGFTTFQFSCTRWSESEWSGFTQREISNSSRTTTKFIKRFHDMKRK